ncbi:MAG: hypothetical protein QGH21_06565, partial [Candidatus Poseidoniia archaeon]|nr:hypothetical protein [Candidatus Poseidoniia archaeon]
TSSSREWCSNCVTRGRQRTLTLRNGGNVPESVAVGITAGAWAVAAPANLTIGPYATLEFNVTVTVPEVLAGSLLSTTVNLAAEETNANALLRLTVEQREQPGIELALPGEFRPAETRNTTLTLYNYGNGFASMELALAAPANWTIGGWDATSTVAAWSNITERQRPSRPAWRSPWKCV